ncbi:MAG: VUT family protein [Trueperaceae bacterium]
MPSLPRSILFIVVTLLAVVACFVLLYLGQYAQFGPPPQQLRVEVILFLGVLFTGFVFPLLKGQTSVTMMTAGLFALLTTFALTRFTLASPTTASLLKGSWLYLLAPAVAVAISLIMHRALRERAALWVAVLVYVMCTVLANYTLDSFIPVPLGVPALAFTGQINVGTLFFGIIFTQRDRIHTFERKYAYVAIGLAVLANILAALFLETPWRFIAVGFLALSLSELADTEVYQGFIKRNWWTRVATSNAVSIPIDSTLFTVLAFLGEAYATPTWMIQVIVTDIIVKLLIGFMVALGVWQARKPELSASSPTA